eukprot:CAMPEP_0119546230 /NCGR_PEP_ID=MMETSP1352-20130426/739_1 /TAXON_ID=265584 /ORGANISM="Stauroneis constricta, Strain CCMP1120" /LENGTH=58 /DNA_ID=CAMNT_0007590909 /DNA_START=88 /DNA_END=260 /DNA_ORIENTATION=-
MPAGRLAYAAMLATLCTTTDRGLDWRTMRCIDMDMDDDADDAIDAGSCDEDCLPALLP